MATAGVFAHPTGGDGCTTGDFVTSGLAASSTPSVTFTAGPSVPPQSIPITVAGNLVLQASPSSFGGSGGTVTLLLTDANGNAVAGAQISATCTAGASSSLVAATDANGRTSASVSGSGLDAYGSAKSATCTFSTGLQGGPTATVNLQGTDLCTVNPGNSQCNSSGGGNTTNEVLSLAIVRGDGVAQTVSVSVTTTPAGLSCTLAPNMPNNVCSASFPEGSPVFLNAIVQGTAGITWSGDCSGTGASAQVTLTAAQTCQLQLTTASP